MTFTRLQRRLISEIRRDMKNSGVRLLIRKGTTVMCDGSSCSGYFSPKDRKVVISSKRDPVLFLSILCHEYGHFLQWRAACFEGSTSARGREWVEYVEAPHLLRGKGGWQSYKALLACERGAELIACEMMNRWGIGTPAERLAYTKSAAVYLYCHRLMYDKRRWFKDGSGDLANWVKDPAIWDALPNTLRGVDFVRIPKNLRKLLLTRF